MADLVCNIAKGRAGEFFNRVQTNDPTNSEIVFLAVVAGSTTDATWLDADTLAAMLPGSGGAAEATNSGYARKHLTDADLSAFTPDDATDTFKFDVPDQTWTAVASGDVWTDCISGYDSDNTTGTDSNIIPMTVHDFAVTPDGSDITAQIHADGLYKAA